MLRNYSFIVLTFEALMKQSTRPDTLGTKQIKSFKLMNSICMGKKRKNVAHINVKKLIVEIKTDKGDD